MATPSHITMLREISAAGDRERTGALDIEWEGAHATLFFIFGHPSHVVFDTSDGRVLVGEPALDAMAAELPTEFRVAPWRRAMVTDDTLHCTAEDLMGLFQRRHTNADSNGHAAAPAAPADASAYQAPTGMPAAGPPPSPASSPARPPFGLRDFPLLPLGTVMWTDASANVINLEAAVPRLPDCVVVLAGPTSQGMALISGGRVADAVHVTATTASMGGDAAHAVLNALEGTLTAYTFDDTRVGSALPMLWRAPVLGGGLPGPWLHTDDVVAEVRTSGRACCLVVASADPGVALFAGGELIAVYSAAHRWPATSMAALRSLLHDAEARVTVLGELTVAAAAEPEAEAAPAGGEAADVVVAPAEDTPAPTADGPDAPAFSAPAELAEVEATVAEPAPAEPPVAEAAVAEPAAPAKGKGRRGRGRFASRTAGDKPEFEPETAPVDEVQPETAPVVEVEPETAPVADAEPEPEPAPLTVSETEAAVAEAEAPAATDAASGDFEVAALSPAAAPAVGELSFEPAVFSIAELEPGAELLPTRPLEDASGMAGVEAREATEFVPARLDIDVEALRTELIDIATVWLGADDAVPVATAIGAARPGVDDFVSAIRAIGTMEIPGHESAVVRAMAREMHFRASEVLCGV